MLEESSNMNCGQFYKNLSVYLHASFNKSSY